MRSIVMVIRRNGCNHVSEGWKARLVDAPDRETLSSLSDWLGDSRACRSGGANGRSRRFRCVFLGTASLISYPTLTEQLFTQKIGQIFAKKSAVDLNCGCPVHFSVHSGMGANLLYTPDLLCDILVKLRATLPPSVAVSAKIRLLPSQEDTLALIKRIVSTGISCLTVHCRTKEMRHREPALIHRLKEIVEYVNSLGLGIPVIANGDCLSRDDAVRLREITGA